MGLLKRRSILVTFRVSPEEHEALQVSRLRCGARSVSEFVRAAALRNAQTLNPGGISGDLMTVSEELRDLDALLVNAHARIRAVLGLEARVPRRGGEIQTATHESS